MPKARLLWIVLITGAIIASTARLSRTETVSVRGHVAFPDGEVPVFGTVTIGKGGFFKATAADPQGNYVFTDLPVGTYNMIVSAIGKQNKAGAATRDGAVIAADTPLPVVVDVVLSTSPAEVRQ